MIQGPVPYLMMFVNNPLPECRSTTLSGDSESIDLLERVTTFIALTLSSNLLGNHFKVHHVVAWWRLMTLSTIG